MLTHAGITDNADLALRVWEFMKAQGLARDAQVRGWGLGCMKVQVQIYAPR